jgi:hypothetical protein
MRGSLAAGPGYRRWDWDGRGSLAWTFDALARVGGWAEAVEGRPGLTSRGTDGL